MGKHTPHMTARYGAIQGCYWSVYSCVFSFAAAFLMAKGYSATNAGVLLALSCLLSCVLQPVFASVADRSRRITVLGLMSGTLGVSFLCLVSLLVIPMPRVVYAGVYLLGALLLDMSIPLLNALSVWYTDRGMPINFGVGRSVGSLAFAAASLLLGFVMDGGGPNAMLATGAGIYLALIVLVLTFPRLKKTAAPERTDTEPLAPLSETDETPCTVFGFFKRYPWFSVSLFGVMLMSAFHAMTENYLIAVLERVGGDSADLGVALAVATVAETPVFLFFTKFKNRAKTGTWLIIAAAAFVAKSVLLLVLRSVTGVIVNQLWQAVTYGLYIPVSVAYASERIKSVDMVKGQAMLTAFYALGCSIGSFTGGRLIDGYGVPAMLWSGVAFALGSFAVFLLSANKKERACTE